MCIWTLTLWLYNFTDGILYGVCQYSVDLTRVLSQPRVEITPGHKSLHLSMTTCATCPGWRPTRVSLSACLKRSLEDGSEYLASRENCVEVETIVSSWSSDVIMIGNLSMFSEYEIEIDFNLEFFNATSLYRVQGRTSKFYRWLVNLSDRCTTTFRFNNIWFCSLEPHSDKCNFIYSQDRTKDIFTLSWITISPLFRSRSEHHMECGLLWPAQGCLDWEEVLLRWEQPREAGLEDREGRGGRDSQGLGDLGDPDQPPSRRTISSDPDWSPDKRVRLIQLYRM